MPPSLAMRSMFGVSPDHQAAVITARLHPADVVAHDEQDVGFLAAALLSQRRRAAEPTDRQHAERDQSDRRPSKSLVTHDIISFPSSSKRMKSETSHDGSSRTTKLAMELTSVPTDAVVSAVRREMRTTECLAHFWPSFKQIHDKLICANALAAPDARRGDSARAATQSPARLNGPAMSTRDRRHCGAARSAGGSSNFRPFSAAA